FSASQKADRNSISNSDFADPARRFTPALLSSCTLPELQDQSYDDHHGERQRQEHLPAEPHQLIVAVPRHHGLDHGNQEKQEANLQREPYHAWNPGEGRHRKWRQPAAQE